MIVCVGVCVGVCVAVCVWVVRPPSGGPRSRRTALPRDRPSARPPFRRTALPPPFSFFSLSGVFSWNFGGVFEGWDPPMCTFGLSGWSYRTSSVFEGRRGFTRQPENSKRAHQRVRALQTPPKFHKKTPRERKKAKMEAGEGRKKERNVGPPTFRGHHRGTSCLDDHLYHSFVVFENVRL